MLWKMPIISIMLIAIVTTPNYLGISAFPELQPRLLNRQVEKVTKTVEVLGISIPTVITTTIEEWSNGTRLHMVFYHLLNSSSEISPLAAPEEIDFSKPREYYGVNSTPLREVIITYTKWITNSSAATKVTTQNNHPSTRPLAVYYPHTRIIDGLWFVLKGEYQGVFATYDHDDNYNEGGYYPLEANTPQNLTRIKTITTSDLTN